MTTKYTLLHLIIMFLICTVLASCGGSENSPQGNSGAGIDFQLKWPVAKSVGSMPSSVVKVRMSVSAPDMTTITKDFDASAGRGSIANVPAGSSRTISFLGLDLSSKPVYEGAVTNVTLEAGITYYCDPVTMRPAVPPAAPTSLSFSSPVAYNRLNLVWIDNANNETGYIIERSATSGGPYKELTTTPPDAVSYGDTTVLASTTYFYRIRATNNFGNSEYSNEISVTTPERSFSISGSVTCGGIPLVGVTISTPNLTGVISGTDGNFSLIGGRQNTSYTLTPGRTGYTFSPGSQTVNIIAADIASVNFSATPSTTPAVPTGLQATAVSTTRISLSWSDNANNESGYKIERSTTSGGPYTEIGTVAADATTYNDLSLFASSTRYYRIRATNALGDSSYSSEVSATTPAVISPVLLKVTGGTFKMGDDSVDSLPDQRPKHDVTIGDYYIGKYEVTQGEWLAIMGTNPSSFTACGANCPVEKVSWDDVQRFISELNKQSGKSYRLPTEAEWEYAARSGELSQVYSGTNDVSVIGSYAWYSGNSSLTTHPVGNMIQPNSLGIYDMSGNVFEWVSDLYGPYPTAPTTGNSYVYRGGSWAASGYGFAQTLRTTYRDRASNSYKSNIIGFRLASSTP